MSSQLKGLRELDGADGQEGNEKVTVPVSGLKV
jgi:hypothetical protein